MFIKQQTMKSITERLQDNDFVKHSKFFIRVSSLEKVQQFKQECDSVDDSKVQELQQAFKERLGS
jgi:Zn-finger domain-containing protein